MRRVTVRLREQQYEVLAGLAQELSTDVTGAFRALVTGHERTQRLLNAFDDAKTEILKAVAVSKEANTENLKRAVHHLTQLINKDSK